jgi:hypothetical protein
LNAFLFPFSGRCFCRDNTASFAVVQVRVVHSAGWSRGAIHGLRERLRA